MNILSNLIIPRVNLNSQDSINYALKLSSKYGFDSFILFSTDVVEFGKKEPFPISALENFKKEIKKNIQEYYFFIDAEKGLGHRCKEGYLLSDQYIRKDIKDLYLHDFGIFIEVSPDEEQKAQLEANIQMALQRDQISLEDAIDIRQLKNIKMANELLKVKRKNKEKKDVDRENEKMQMQSQINMQSQQAAAQSAIEQAQAETQAKIQVKQAEIAFEIEKMNAEAALKKELMLEEFNLQMQIKNAEQLSIDAREKSREDAKASRISQQNTQQSKLIQQRKQDLPPVDFESNEDSLDGFDLAEFEPR